MASSTAGCVQVATAPGRVVLTIANPDRRNAITLDIARAIEAAIEAAANDPEVHALVVTGAGSTFCAGADRGLLAAADETELRAVYRAFLAVRECPVPSVAAVNGPAVGAGLNLALSCDVRIAATSAVFDPRFLQLPIHPGGGHLWMLERLVGPQVAAAMVMFDQPLTAQRAAEVGLIWSVVPDGEVLPAAIEFCERLCTSPTPTLARRIKRTLRVAEQTSEHLDAVEYELREQVASMATPEFRSRIARGR